MEGAKRSAETRPSSPSWANETVQVPTETKRYGVYVPNFISVDFSALGVPVDSVIGQTIKALAIPAHHKRMALFVRGVEALLQDDECRRIIGTPARGLTMMDLRRLYSSHENWVASDDVDFLGAETVAAHFRGYFRRVEEPLVGGSRVADVKFRSRFKKLLGSGKTLLSEQPDPHAAVEFSGPISELEHTGLKDLESKALDHLKHRSGRLEASCWELIDRHLAFRDHIKEVKAKPLPRDLAERSTRNRLDLGAYTFPAVQLRLETHDRLFNDRAMRERYILHWAEQGGIRSDPTKMKKASHALLQNLTWEGSIVTRAKGRTSSYIAEGGGILTTGDGHTACVAEYFLSHAALLACQYLIQIKTSWNPDVVRAMTRDQFVFGTDGDLTLNGHKTKVDQHLPPRHFGKDEVKFHGLIKMLLEHDANVTKFMPRRSASVFCGVQRNYRAFGLFNPKNAHKAFIAAFRLPWFSPGQIRDQVVNTAYLTSDRNVLVVRELLGHADLSSIDTYLNHHIQRVLGKANMAEFVRRLDVSVRYRTSNNPECAGPPEKVLTLFAMDSSDCLADRWLKSGIELEIDEVQIAHCVWQKNYYEGNAERLCNENPHRFERIHLPRIVFCVALYYSVSASPYRYVLKKIEREYQERNS